MSFVYGKKVWSTGEMICMNLSIFVNVWSRPGPIKLRGFSKSILVKILVEQINKC